MEFLLLILLFLLLIALARRTQQKVQKNKKQDKNAIQHKIILGIAYEMQIADYYHKKGYNVILHGLKYGLKDQGIDLICTKNNELLLIQCKNWPKRELQQEDITKFIKNCSSFINKLSIHDRKRKKIKRIFIISNHTNKSLWVKYKNIIHYKKFDASYMSKVNKKKVKYMCKDKNATYL